MKPLSDAKIVDSWKKNVSPWLSAVQNDEIASRVLVTNQAILDAVASMTPKSVLDIGCGEGWLVRALAESNVDALGTDVVAGFIDHGKDGAGRFRVLPYEELSIETVGETFDAVVSNFSLLGEESVERVFQKVPNLLQPAGTFIVQTIHPVTGCGEQKYEDGWRRGSWEGFSDEFQDPAPWYFRTLETWKALFENNGFVLRDIQEPVDPRSNAPASIVFVGELSG